MLEGYHRNDRVIVHIDRAIPSGLLGQVVDGPRAIIRRREIAWEETDDASYFDTTHEAVVVGFDWDRQQLELSLRFAQRNPWETAEDLYPVGREIQGSVTGLIETAAFVELEPGLEAMLPLSELPLDTGARIEDWLWIDDTVCATVDQIDASQHRLRLSLTVPLRKREAAYRRRLWHEPRSDYLPSPTLSELLPSEIRTQLLNWAQELDIDDTTSPLTALVIEDDEVFSTGLQRLLSINRCEAEIAPDGIRGLDRVLGRDEPFDLILIEWNLPGPKGHDIARALQREGVDSHLSILLELATLRDHPEVRMQVEASGVDVIDKSDPAKCRRALITMLHDLRVDAPAKRRPVTEGLEASAGMLPPLGMADTDTAPQTSFAKDTQLASFDGGELLLQSLLCDTGASTALLLRMEMGASHPHVEASVGQPFPIETAPPDVVYSPLNDVLVKRRPVSELVDPGSRRFARLLSLAPFEGFLGVPVPPTDAARYGLFLLKASGSFGDQHAVFAQNTAYLIARSLQSRRFIQALTRGQGHSMTGQMLGNAIHELTNKLVGLSFQIEALDKRVRTLSRSPQHALDATTLRELVQDVEAIAKSQQQATAITGQYLGLITHGPKKRIDLKALARSTLDTVKPEAQVHNILLILNADENVPEVTARPGLLQQVLLNLLLNAIQQMAALDRAGQVTMSLSRSPDKSDLVQIRVSDEGPGIHTSLWERIFDFGFTTREGGAGLGLTISRQIVTEELGGTLCVEESLAMWGTTFLVELPSGE